MGMVAAGIALMAWTAEVGWQLIVGAALIGLAAAWRDDRGGDR